MSPIDDNLMYVVRDTIKSGRQALIFVNSKKRAEKTAEDIAKNVVPDPTNQGFRELSNKLRTALAQPTKQCTKAALCTERGVAFHHAGLTTSQRTAIEDAFRAGELPIICCTPTLALGIDMPAFRTIIRDLKRFSGRRMAWIPVMEYHQMAGRAGRPGKETEGQAIIMWSSEKGEEEVIDKYIHGQPENVISKLAVEPVLRIYLLSLISINFVNTIDDIYDFFSKTFWAYQFEDMDVLKQIIGKMLFELEQMGFIKHESFEVYKTTPIGKRVAELYVDPLSAHKFIQDMKYANKHDKTSIEGFLMSVCQTLEMRPLLRVKSTEYDQLGLQLEDSKEELFFEFDPYDDDNLWETLESFKTMLLLRDWISEKNEDAILEKFDVRPGELSYKVDRCQWLLYTMKELCRMAHLKGMQTHISKLRTRVQYGIKEELLSFVRIKGIGRVRSRQLIKAGLKDMKALRSISIQKLASIIGTKVAVSIKEQLGEKVNDAYNAAAVTKDTNESKVTTRAGSTQSTLSDF